LGNLTLNMEYMKFDDLVKSIMESVKEKALPTIKVLHDYVKDKRVYNIPIKRVIHELKPTKWERGEERPGTKEFIKRANKADLKYPIIVFRGKAGKLFVMDGVHRIWKANKDKRKTIKAHILTLKQSRMFKWRDHNGITVSFLNESINKLCKGYVFPNGEIFNDINHADAWDNIPSNIDHKKSMKYVNNNGEVVLQGKLNKSIAKTFEDYGIDVNNIRYGAIDDEMLEINKKSILDKISKLGWVNIGGGYKTITKIYNDEVYYTYIKTPSGEFYEGLFGGVTPEYVKIIGGPEKIIETVFYKKVIPMEIYNNNMKHWKI